MLRGVIQTAALFLVAAGAASAAIFPDKIGDFQKGPPKTISVPDQALLDEYGLSATEQAEYKTAEKHFTATAWRFHDSTGAMAMFEFRRPPGAVSSGIAKLAVQTSDGAIFAYGNYVFQLTGNVPPAEQFTAMYATLPKLEQSPLPVLLTDLPPAGLVPNSERYVVGPVSLDRFEPRIPPSIAAFHLGSEAIVGKYTTAKGLLTLAIFNYPTPGIARERYQNFQNISGAIAKRVGALVAVTIQPPDADAAERILSQVKYETNITWNEKVPVNEVKGAARFILDVFAFSGLLILICLIAGLGYAGVRFANRKMNRSDDPDAMITLHLGNK
ncbi:MAG TPA: DUF6599 family protein [Bryobacteraceae bacterium]|nr:DUF6599 family protein [Bryobacteraceae bacterium]